MDDALAAILGSHHQQLSTHRPKGLDLERLATKFSIPSLCFKFTLPYQTTLTSPPVRAMSLPAASICALVSPCRSMLGRCRGAWARVTIDQFRHLPSLGTPNWLGT